MTNLTRPDDFSLILPGCFLNLDHNMSDGDREILKLTIEGARDNDYPQMPIDKYFEIFAAQQVLNLCRVNLDADEILSGIVGQHRKYNNEGQPATKDSGGGDGGIDGFYIFAGTKFVREDADITQFKNMQLKLDLVIIQAKNKASFEEGVPTKFQDFVEHCLRVQSPLTEAAKREIYSETLLTLVKKFHDIYRGSAGCP